MKMLKITQNHIRIVAIAWLVVSVVLLVLSIARVRNSGENVTWIYWAYPLGAFVWEDLVSISLYNITISVAVAIKKQYRLALLSALLFWLVRSAGEMLYWFLQQFTQSPGYPHSDYGWDRAGWFASLFPGISDQKWFILHQVNYQVLTVLCLIGLFLLIKSWKRLKSS
jgi:hypothetical protein